MRTKGRLRFTIVFNVATVGFFVCHAGGTVALAQNLVQNPSFEDGSANWTLVNLISSGISGAHSGSRAAVGNLTGTPNKSASQSIMLPRAGTITRSAIG